MGLAESDAQACDSEGRPLPASAVEVTFAQRQ